MRNPCCGVWILIVSCLVAGCGFKTNPRPATATIPGEVGLVTAYAFPDRVVLKWAVPAFNTDGSPLEDISGFKIYRRAEKIGEECETCEEKRRPHANVDFQKPVDAVIEQGEVVYTDKTPNHGHTYSYSVSAYNLKGREAKISTEVPVVFEEPPPPPAGLRVRVDPKGVLLEWEGPPRASGIENYRLYRGTSDKPDEMKSIGGTTSGETTYLDKDVQRDKTYYYQVRSLKMNRGISLESNPSQSVRAEVPAVLWSPPENVNTAATREGIRVYWDPVKIEKKDTRYNIYRSEAGKVFEKLNPEPLANPWFVDKKVVVGRTYRYAVTAFPRDRTEDESARAGSEAVKYSP